MKKREIYSFKGLYRDDFKVTGYEFGQGEKTVCIVGSFRGNEYQQIYVCSRLIDKLKGIEADGKIKKGMSIMVIPCANTYSVNIKKRFWSIDNTDINRMFPGYDLGETTQRIADGIFKVVKEYKYGIQFASFYMPGHFIPQVRMMKTGNENVELARKFGLPYIVFRRPRPFDTTTLNYNWQIWETEAFSIYTTSTEKIDKKSATLGVNAVINFLEREGIIEYDNVPFFPSKVVESDKFITVRSSEAGFLDSVAKVGALVHKGQILAYITDPYTAKVLQTVKAGSDGIIAFAYDSPLAYKNTALFKIIPEH